MTSIIPTVLFPSKDEHTSLQTIITTTYINCLPTTYIFPHHLIELCSNPTCNEETPEIRPFQTPKLRPFHHFCMIFSIFWTFF